MNNLTLKDCCSFQEGYVNPTQTIRDYFNGPIKWLRASDLNDSFVYNTEKTLSIKGFNSAGKSAFLFKKDTIAISKSGTIGRLGILKDEMCGNRAVININVNNEISDLFYVFYTLIYKKNEIIGKAGGSIQKNLYVSALETISLNHRYKLTQQKIASVLFSLDSKIELNNRINAELEAMAKTLYDYWFVQFDFPNEQGKPYKTSGGKMVWNEELKREVPEGWEVKKIRDFATTGSGGTPLSTNKEYYENGDIPWINSGEVNNPFIIEAKKYITQKGLENASTKLFKKGTLLVAMYGATAGKVSILDIEACTNQAICSINTYQEIHKNYLKFVLDDLYDYLINLSTGSARDNLSQEKIKELQILMPRQELIEKFDIAIYSCYNKILTSYRENQKLTDLRDWLLPMLMNGQVKVGEVEEMSMAAEPEGEYKKS